MANIDELRQHVHAAKSKDEEGCQQVAGASEKVRETGAEITTATTAASKLGRAFGAMTMDSATQRARAIASRLKQLLARTGGVNGGLNTVNSELAEIASEVDVISGEIDVLRGLLSGSSGASGTAVVPLSPPVWRDLAAIGGTEGMAGIRSYEEAGTAEGNLFFATGKHNHRPLRATLGTTAFRPGEVKPEWRDTKPAQGTLRATWLAWDAESVRRPTGFRPDH